MKIIILILILCASAFVYFIKKDKLEYQLAEIESVTLPKDLIDQEDIPVTIEGKTNPCMKVNLKVHQLRKRILIHPELERKETCEGDGSFKEIIKIPEIPYGEHEVVIFRKNGDALRKKFDRNLTNWKLIVRSDLNLNFPSRIQEGESFLVNVELTSGTCMNIDYPQIFLVENILMIYVNALDPRGGECKNPMPRKFSFEKKDLKKGTYLVWQMDAENHYIREKELRVD